MNVCFSPGCIYQPYPDLCIGYVKSSLLGGIIDKQSLHQDLAFVSIVLLSTLVSLSICSESPRLLQCQHLTTIHTTIMKAMEMSERKYLINTMWRRTFFICAAFSFFEGGCPIGFELATEARVFLRELGMVFGCEYL